VSDFSSYLADQSTRRQVFVQRFGASEAHKLEQILLRIEAKLINEFESPIPRMSAIQQADTLRRVQRIMDESLANHGDQLLLDMRAFLEVETEFTHTLLQGSVNVDTLRPSREQLQSAMETGMNAPVGKGLTISDAIEVFDKNKAAEMVQVVRDGFVTGSTSEQLITEIVKTTEIQRRHAEALVRTSTNHMAAQARKLTEEANSDIVDGFIVVATLDSRTTLICAGLDGKRFPHDADRPPFHWNCRSTTIPYIKPEFRIPDVDGDRPSIGGKGAEQVSGDTKYGGWLRRQPAAFQDDVLGKTRGALFRRGGIKIEQFTDRNRATYTLDDLKRNNASAFEKANV
jgi:SPP1 gp7 family putative phage head morphogenesis protein